MTYLLSFDPGRSTGIALGIYTDTDPYHRFAYWQIEDGLNGFLEWYDDDPVFSAIADTAQWTHFRKSAEALYDRFPEEIVSEKFVLANNAFVADTTPLLIEGAMIALELNPVWQQRTDKALVPDRILKDGHLWLTGKDVGCKDARDVNDATIHALAFLKKRRHEPTIRHYWGEK